MVVSVQSSRIRESMSANDPTKKISGDKGGKGEVLALLKIRSNQY